MKYILYVCIVLFLTYLGYFISGRYRLRRKFIHSWTIFHQNFLNDVQYARRPLRDIIDSLAFEGDFATFIKKFKEKHVFEEKISYLDKEENALLEEYFSTLGRSDYAAQKDYFSSISKRLNEEYTKCRDDAKKSTDLYIKLGFLLGLAIVILLI